MASGTLLTAALGLILGYLLLRAFLNHRSRPGKEQMTSLLENGAIILDVRTSQEFSEGHAPGSRNIPLDRLAAQLPQLDRKKPILVCCASGARSGMAKSMLEKAGFAAVSNVGPWQRLL